MIVVALAGVASCATRSVPDAPPDSSPTATAAEETPRASVTAALESDPPLPGTRDPRWLGLSDGETETSHREHAGHAAETEPVPPPQGPPSQVTPSRPHHPHSSGDPHGAAPGHSHAEP